MKRSVRLGALTAAVVLTAVVGSTPAKAAGPFTIEVGDGTYGALQTVFEDQRCDASIVSGPLNGSDARIIDVTQWANRHVTLRWTMPWAPVSGHSVGFLTSSQMVYNGACQRTTVIGTSAGAAAMSFFVPLGSKWMLVSAYSTAHVSFTAT